MRGAAGRSRSRALGRFVRPLRERPDKEHEIALNRVAISTIALIYLFSVPASGYGIATARQLACVFAVATLALVAHLLLRGGVSVGRRGLGMLLDLGILSAGLLVGGVYVAALYPLYLWVIFGNGFRFGLPYLAAAAGIAIALFAAIIHLSAYWRANYPLGVGLLVGLAVLPGYAAVLIRKLSLARDQAEQANRAKTLFLASVSHELRTPLNAVIGMSDLLRNTPLRPDQRDMVHTVRDSARALVAQIDELLNVSRLDAGKVEFERLAFDPAAVLRDTARLVAAQAGAKGVRLGLHVTPRSPRAVLGDPRRLGQVLLNLAGNAVKFTPAGSVVLALDATPAPGGSLLRFEVSDTGIGIAPDAQGRIFDVFTQADSSIMNDFGGTGLGLSISRRLVQLQGGSIGVESAPGAGSTFWFTLPAGEAAPAAMPAVTGRRAVILAENQARLPLVAELAAAAGMHPAVARSTGEALRLLAARDASEQVPLDAPGETPGRVAGEASASAPGHASGNAPGNVPGSSPGAAPAEIPGSTPAGAPANVAAALIVLGEDAAPERWSWLEAALPDGRPGGVPGGATALLVLPDAAAGLPPPALRRQFFAVLSAGRLRTELPAALRALSVVQEAANDDARPILRRAAGRRILVVDDNRVNQMVITRMLDAAGHQVVLADNGEEALDRLDEGGFDLALMDLNMPVMGGIDAAKHYRMASLDLPHLPIVALTADATSEARDRALEAGMDAVLTKPVDVTGLLALIDRLLAGKPPASQPLAARAAAPAPPATPAAWLDEKMLADLTLLGGAEFVADLVATFVVEAGTLVAELGQAAVEPARFRDTVHALRSTAANLGALALTESCRTWQQADDATVRARGGEIAEQLAGEFEATRAALLRRQRPVPSLASRRN